ncbi:hypothetical protein D3C71_1289370 [compost metagenome]
MEDKRIQRGTGHSELNERFHLEGKVCPTLIAEGFHTQEKQRQQTDKQEHGGQKNVRFRATAEQVAQQ